MKKVGLFRFYPSSFVSSDPSATALETAPEMPDEACTLTMDDVYVAAFKFEPAEDGDLAIEPGDVRIYFTVF